MSFQTIYAINYALIHFHDLISQVCARVISVELTKRFSCISEADPVT